MAKLEVKNVGTVLEVADGISRIYGLSDAMSSELVEFEDGKGKIWRCLSCACTFETAPFVMKK